MPSSMKIHLSFSGWNSVPLSSPPTLIAVVTRVFTIASGGSQVMSVENLVQSRIKIWMGSSLRLFWYIARVVYSLPRPAFIIFLKFAVSNTLPVIFILPVINAFMASSSPFNTCSRT